jgi:DNA-binding transcriptional regulator YiaG
MWGIVASFERRADGDAELMETWGRAVGLLGGRRGTATPLVRSVLANALAIVHLGEVSDIEHLAQLVTQLGGQKVAEFQDETLAAVDGPSRELTTALARSLGQRAWGLPAATAGVVDLADRPDLVAVCADTAIWLMTVGDRAPEPPPINDLDDLLTVFRDGDVLTWRALAGATRAEPWSGAIDKHMAMLDPEAQAAELRSLQAVSAMIRRIVEDDERAAIASHIRNAIAETGLTQREFAALVGTSSSRLSTYATGAVTPSAAMLLRINRAARRARRGDLAD